MITRNSTSASPTSAGRSPESARDVLRILYRHRRKMVAVFFSVLALAVVGLIVFPRSYTSEARMFVRLGKESVGLDPTATTSEVMSVSESRESEINSELEILRSRVLLEDVVERLGADYVLSDNPTSEAGPSKEGGWLQTLMVPLQQVKVWLRGEISEEERAIGKLAETIEVSSPRRSHILIVKNTARHPKQAQKILQTFMAAYQSRHAEANRIQGSYDFFVDQSDLLDGKLSQASQALRDAKNQNGILSIEGHKANMQAQASSIELALLTNHRALSASEARIASLRQQLAALPATELAEESDSPNAAVTSMRNELYKLQISEQEASSRYTKLHPRVIALRRQVDEMRKILAAEETRSNHKTHKLSVVHQSMRTQLATATTEAAAAAAESRSLKTQLADVQSKIRALNDNELLITDLTRQVALLESDFRTHTTNRERARVNAALEVGRISNVNVLQPASYVAKPASPVFRLTIVLAFVLASLSSVLVAFIAEHFDRSLQSAEQVEQELGIPVLFSVPRGVRHETIQG